MVGARSTIWTKPARRDVADSSRPVPRVRCVDRHRRQRARSSRCGTARRSSTASRCRSTWRSRRPTSSSVPAQRRRRAATARCARRGQRTVGVGAREIRRLHEHDLAARREVRREGPVHRVEVELAPNGASVRSLVADPSPARAPARSRFMSPSAASRWRTGPVCVRLVGVGDDGPADPGSVERGAERADLGVVGGRVVLRDELRPAERTDAAPERATRCASRTPRPPPCPRTPRTARG